MRSNHQTETQCTASRPFVHERCRYEYHREGRPPQPPLEVNSFGTVRRRGAMHNRHCDILQLLLQNRSPEAVSKPVKPKAGSERRNARA